MQRPPLTVTIITLNEEAHLPDALKSVAWADEIIVVDSGSTDRTCEIARQAGARVETRSWQGYGQQKNHAQSLATHDWVLNIDADERVSAELRREIEGGLAEAQAQGVAGFEIPRRTFYLGRWIRYGGWYPNYLVRLARRSAARWTEPRVHEALQVSGTVGRMRADLEHYTFSSIQDQIETNLRFSRLGYRALRERGQRASLLRLVLKPIWKFIEVYLIKLGFLDGVAGYIIAINSAHSTFLKYAYLIEDENPCR